MNGTDRVSHYPYHKYHHHHLHQQHYPQHHHYQQPHHRHHHSHHSLPPLAVAAAAGSFPFSFDVDGSLPTGGRRVESASRVFTTQPSTSTAAAGAVAAAECCYSFDEGLRRYASNGLSPSSGAPAPASYLGFRSPSTSRPNIDATGYAAASAASLPEMTSQTASPAANCSGGLFDAKGARPKPVSDMSNCAASVGSPVTSSVRGCCDEVYAAQSDDAPRHHRRLSTDDNNDDVIKNVNKTDIAASPSRDHGHHTDRMNSTDGAELKRDVSERLSV